MSSKLDFEQIIPLVTDETNEALQVNVVAGTLTTTEGATAADGGALPALTKVVSGYDGSAVQVLKTDANGELQIDVLSSALPTGAATAANQVTGNSSLASIDTKLTDASQKTQIVDGSGNVVSTTANALDVNIASGVTLEVNLDNTDDDVLVYGFDGASNQKIKTDVAGELQVDVLTLPAVTATDLDIRDLSHTQDSVKIGDGTDFALITASGELNVLSTAQPGVDIGDVTVNNAAGAAAVNIQDGGNSITVDGTLTVTSTDLDIRDLTSVSDSVSAVQSGTWNITDITGTVSLPTGASTLAEQQTQTTSLQLIDDTVATTGAAITTKGIAAAGTDGTNARILKTDAAGELQVDVLTMPTVTVTATDLDIRDLTHVSDSIRLGDGTDLVNVTAAGELNVLATAQPGVDVGDVTINNAAGASAVNIQDGGNSITVDGTVTVSATDLDIRDLTHISDSIKIGDGVDFLAITAAGEALVSLTTALPAGNNNIGDVDVASIVPGTGATNLGKAEDAVHTSGDVGVMALAVRNDAGTPFAADGDYVPLSTDSTGAVRIAGTFSTTALTVVDFADTPLITATNINGSAGAFYEIVASLAANVKKVQVFDTSGINIGLYVGPAASEVLALVFGPGSNETTELTIASSTRVSLRALETSGPTAGFITINFIG